MTEEVQDTGHPGGHRSGHEPALREQARRQLGLTAPTSLVAAE
mgnify:CR=1 FL=1